MSYSICYRQKVTYGEIASDIVNHDERRNHPQAQMVWTLKSALASEKQPKVGKDNHENSRQLKQHRSAGISHKG